MPSGEKGGGGGGSDWGEEGGREEGMIDYPSNDSFDVMAPSLLVMKR